MDDIEIRKVDSRKSLRRFIQFGYDLYEGNEYYVPDLRLDLWDTFTEKNPAREFCDCQLFLALRNGEVAGRVAAIVNRKANETWGRKTVRFGWIDFVDDRRVSAALLRAVEDWGRERGMTEVEGPLGFTDMDPEGMLIEGFEELGTMATIYNYPYYKAHMEDLGFAKATDWIEKLLRVPERVPERLERISKIVMEKYGLGFRHYRHTSSLARDYGQEIFHVINAAFKPLFGYSELSQKQIDQYVSTYIKLVDPRLVSLIVDKEGRLVGVGISMASMSRALQRSKGKLFPTGWWPLLKALKLRHSTRIDLMLVAVLPQWQGRGVNALFFYDLLPHYIAAGYKDVETNIELEDNLKVQSQWIYFEGRQHKRRRCWRKDL